MMRWQLLGVMALAACAGGAASEGRTSPLAAGRRDEVITIGAHNEIAHVAAGERLVFAATGRGVIIYDALFRGWLPPFEEDDAFPRTPTALAADPSEDAAWIATTGRIAYYRPRIDYAVTATVLGTPQEIFFDRRDLGAGAYVRAGPSFVRPLGRSATAGAACALANDARRIPGVSIARNVPPAAHAR
jgi:hypothetical protein